MPQYEKKNSPIVSLLENRALYLREVKDRTMTRIGKICLGQEPSILEQRIQNRLSSFIHNIDSDHTRIPNETESQHIQRLGWMVQATAIELLGENDFKRNNDRIAWKNDLVSEILTVRNGAQSHSLPGIRVKYREPYQDYLDMFSTNRVVIEFTDQPSSCHVGFLLHVATSITELFTRVGDIDTARELIKGYEPMTHNTNMWL